MKIIMVVEDNDSVRDVMVQMLLFLPGVNVITETDGLSGLNRIINAYPGEEIALVIMDVGLPIMNGLDAYKKMRETGTKIPIIMISGSKTEDLLKEELIIDKHLYVYQKPFKFPEILSVIRYLLKLKKAD